MQGHDWQSALYASRTIEALLIVCGLALFFAPTEAADILLTMSAANRLGAAALPQ